MDETNIRSNPAFSTQEGIQAFLSALTQEEAQRKYIVLSGRQSKLTKYLGKM